MLKAEVAMAGERAHVARPWAGRNALHRLAPLLATVADWPGRKVEIEGCTYRESLQAVAVAAGVASNVLPDKAVIELNYRFAPDQDENSAAAGLRALVDPWLEEADVFRVTDSAPSARPALGHPLLADLVSAAHGSVSGKLGWTDVAFFAERGVPAANFGPGDPQLAHTAGEMVMRSSLERARTVLGRLVGE